MEWHFTSALPGVAWPGIPGASTATTLALLDQLEQSQWLPAERLRERQQEQLDILLAHAASTVPYYRRRGAGKSLPLLSRRELQEHFEELKSERVPREHGAVFESRTSGSTGAPVRLLKTQVSQLFWNAINLREHRWHRRDLMARLATIRHGIAAQETASWGPATAAFVTGPAAVLGIDADVDSQIAWLRAQAPGYLLTYPSIVTEIARTCLAHGVRIPGLREVRSFGEALSPETRALCREALGVPVADMYSAEETGYIALQCPQGERYHVQAESLLVEVLDERDRPCQPGEVGKVVVTDLHNFAMPLIRYEIGDYAEAGPPCPCGRGLPVLTRILGRVRNMLVAADGKRYWPTFGQRGFPDIAPVLQHQFVQVAHDLVEARLVTHGPLTPDQSQKLEERIASRLPPGIQVKVVRVDSIARSPTGKYDDFVSRLA
jgi:phenylacetate-CoA ligase